MSLPSGKRNIMYQIIIRKTVNKIKTIGKAWQPIERIGEKTEYGYTPEVESTQTETTEIYTQVVEELDLVSVIKAVNKSGD